MTTIITQKMQEFHDHPCTKYCNNLIGLHAARTGGSGYDGKENLADWLRPALEDVFKAGQEEERKDWANGCPDNTLKIRLMVRDEGSSVDVRDCFLTEDMLKNSNRSALERMFQEVMAKFVAESKILQKLLGLI